MVVSRVAVLTSFYVPAYKGGGPIRTIEALIAQAPERFQFFVLTSDRDLGEEGRLDVHSNQWQQNGHAQVYYASSDRLLAYLRGLSALRSARPEVLYLNSFFDLKFSIFPLLLARLGFFGQTAVLLAPRGEFSGGALGLKTAKKRLFIQVTSFFGLYRKVFWHASTVLERDDIRATVKRPHAILVRSNETLLSATPGSVLEQRHERHHVRAVFASRIVPKKGLDILIEALLDIPGRICLDVIGGEEDGQYMSHCKRIASKVSSNVAVRFIGPMEHDDLLRVFPSYDVMLFPTLGENFGHVIAEALAAGVPVYCSTHTPWSDLLSRGGRLVDPNIPSEWARVVGQLSTMSREQLDSARVGASEAFKEWERGQEQESVLELLEKELVQNG